MRRFCRVLGAGCLGDRDPQRPEIVRARPVVFSVRRVLVLTQGFSRDLQAAFIQAVPSIHKSVRADGRGSVRFGNSSPLVSMYANTGMDSIGSFYGKDVPTFFDIRDADKVYDLVTQIRNTV